MPEPETASSGRPPAIFLLGPTASGKTALAAALYERLPVELISVDAAQVYRGMDIGTAKPSRMELARTPHRLIDIRDPAMPYSAAEFRDDALLAMAEITAAGRIPLLVGGTMFYFNALEHGLSELPAADPEIRARLMAEAEASGWPALHARLAAVDPDRAARIGANDPQRIQRALEILELSGTPPSRLQRGRGENPLPYHLIKIGISPKIRSVLHARIERRFDAMLKAGLVGEVQSLMQRGDLTAELPAMRTVGYRQVWQYLTHETEHSEMVKRAVAATRQLAKRQLTWMRHNEGLCWFDSMEPGLLDSVMEYLTGRLRLIGYN